jgi:hypothetical protein
MRKMKEIKDMDKRVVMCQIETVKNTFKKDFSNDAKLTLLENTLHIVEANKGTLGKTKNMSSLEKNRIALNLISSLKRSDSNYLAEKERNVNKNIRYQENRFDLQFYKSEVGKNHHPS